MYKIVDIIRYRAIQHPAVIASGVITNVFIIISVLSAFPWIRKSVTFYSNPFTMTNGLLVPTTMYSKSTTALSDG